MIRTLATALAVGVLALGVGGLCSGIVALTAQEIAPEPIRVRSGDASTFDLGDVTTGGGSSGLATLTTSNSVILSSTPSLSYTSPTLSHSTDALVTIAVPSDRVPDLLQAIAARGTVMSVRMPDNYCQPQRAPAVAERRDQVAARD